MRPRRDGGRGNEFSLTRWIVILVLLGAMAILGKRTFDFDDGGGENGGLIRGEARVVDGDSLTVGRARIRLKGIDAPEGPQTCTRAGRQWDCGEDARRTLERLIGGEAVSCRSRGRDKHGRVLAFCSTPAHALNAAMVASGFAFAYGDFVAEENTAKTARLGLWAGEFQRPRDWRHERGIGE